MQFPSYNNPVLHLHEGKDLEHEMVVICVKFAGLWKKGREVIEREDHVDEESHEEEKNQAITLENQLLVSHDSNFLSNHIYTHIMEIGTTNRDRFFLSILFRIFTDMCWGLNWSQDYKFFYHFSPLHITNFYKLIILNLWHGWKINGWPNIMLHLISQISCDFQMKIMI